MSRFLRFGVVGGVGFFVDAVTLALLLATIDLNPFLLRIVSIAVALTVTWQLNRIITFNPSRRALYVEGGRYGGVGFATSAINYLVYSACLLAIPGMPPLLALVIGSASAMILSYFGYAKLVFDR